MRPFEQVRSVVIPMPERDINTDEIIPARFMSRPRQDYGRYFFHDRRFSSDGSPREGYVLNDPRYRDARILLAGSNFGCGSSREHAVFTLADFGVRVVMAPKIADIFHANCFKNGVLPIAVSEGFAQEVLEMVGRQPDGQVDVDLEHQKVTLPTGAHFEFEIDPFRKRSLLRGQDDIARTLEFMADIEGFEARRAHIP
jgi:3-isopropylmalate/(R)-2-methylmalate dehydratase small subunit